MVDAEKATSWRLKNISIYRLLEIIQLSRKNSNTNLNLEAFEKLHCSFHAKSECPWKFSGNGQVSNSVHPTLILVFPILFHIYRYRLLFSWKAESYKKENNYAQLHEGLVQRVLLKDYKIYFVCELKYKWHLISIFLKKKLFRV